MPGMTTHVSQNQTRRSFSEKITLSEYDIKYKRIRAPKSFLARETVNGYIDVKILGNERLYLGPIEIKGVRINPDYTVRAIAKAINTYGLGEGDTIDCTYFVDASGSAELHIALPSKLLEQVNKPFCLDLERWFPREEKDLYYVIGFMQAIGWSKLSYCHSVTEEFSRTRGGILKPNQKKPDAFMIDNEAQRPVIVELKKHSTDYPKTQYRRDDADVLIVWVDDMVDQQKRNMCLPPKIICLRDEVSVLRDRLRGPESANAVNRDDGYTAE